MANYLNKVNDYDVVAIDLNKKLCASVLPILQSYKLYDGGEWSLSENSRLVILKRYLNNVRLKEVMSLVHSELNEKDLSITVVYASESEVTSKDIVIYINEDDFYKDHNEIYKIEIGENGIKIIAPNENSVLHALRTIEQLLIVNGSLPYGEILDYPNVSERRLHVDIGRKYISKDWIIRHIKELSYFKMNTIQLHFSENLGFRIESEFDPDIVSRDGYLTKDEIKEILEEARKYGVKVIPALDTPGHMGHILKIHPEFGQVNIRGNRSEFALDITNQEAIKYVKCLYKEYIDLFEECIDFHIGGDEYMEFDREPFVSEYKEVLDKYAKENFGQEYSWKDTIANYINDIASFVYENGFKPRIWNDGIYYGEKENYVQNIKMHDYIGIDFWSQLAWNPNIAKLNTFIDKGHKDIYNVNANFFYYILRNFKPEDGRPQHSFYYIDQDVRIYNEWTPGKFEKNIVDDDSPFIKGVSLAIWCDKPDVTDEETITKDIAKELRALASKSWNTSSNFIVDIDTFKSNYEKLGNLFVFDKGSTFS